MKQLLRSLVVVAALVTSGAHAGLLSGFGSDPGTPIDYSFDNNSGIFGVLSMNTGGTFQTGDVSGVSTSPLGAVGSYWAIGPANGPGQIDFLLGQTALSFLWGSPDLFNSLTVTLNNSVDVLVPSPGASGNNADSTYLFLSTDAGDLITKLTFKSEGVAYEVDNMRIAIPEPKTYALLLAGLGAVGFLARRRRMPL